MKKIRILSIIPNRNDATSFYRSIGPLSELTRRDNLNIEVMEPSSVSWPVVAASCDILFMQRPYKEDHLTMLELAKRQNKPVWVDYDDDLFSVPESNPAHATYSNDKTRKIIATIIAKSDVVTVSTEPLRAALQDAPTGPLAKRCEVIRNALPTHIIPEMPLLPKKRNKLFCWRGSATHNEDVELWIQDILNAASDLSDHTFYFQGDVPWRLKKQATKNMEIFGAIDILDYFYTLKQLQPKCMLVPLASNYFNNCKSDIAYLEGLWAGSLCIGPNMTEWSNPATLNYEYKQGSFYEKIMKVAEMSDEQVNAKVREARESRKCYRIVSDANDKREEIIRGLVGA
jgi:hypothetical protein